MIFDWYKLLNYNEFISLGLISRTLTVFLEGVGQEDVLVTVGNEFGITFRDAFLPLSFEGQNPFYRDGYAIYEDPDGNVWLGIESTEDEE